MKYYLIQMNTLSAGDIFPIVKGMGEDYDMDSPRSFDHLVNYYGKFVDFEPDLNGIVLQDEAILTDFIEGIPNRFLGLLISARLKESLEPILLGKHQFFPATVIHKEKSFVYFYLHICLDAKEWIDFKSSDFYTAKYTGTPVEPIIFNSLEEYTEWTKTYSKSLIVRANSLVVNCPTPFPEIFNLPLGVSGRFASEYFREVVETGGFTGMIFKEVKSIKFNQIG